MTDVQAAIGRVQLPSPRGLHGSPPGDRRASTTGRSRPSPSSRRPPTADYGDHAWHLYVLRLNLERLSIDRARFIEALAERNIGTSVHFIPIHLHPYYRDKYGFRPDDLPSANAEFYRTISLPLSNALSLADAQTVVDAVPGRGRAHVRPVRATERTPRLAFARIATSRRSAKRSNSVGASHERAAASAPSAIDARRAGVPGDRLDRVGHGFGVAGSVGDAHLPALDQVAGLALEGVHHRQPGGGVVVELVRDRDGGVRRVGEEPGVAAAQHRVEVVGRKDPEEGKVRARRLGRRLNLGREGAGARDDEANRDAARLEEGGGAQERGDLVREAERAGVAHPGLARGLLAHRARHALAGRLQSALDELDLDARIDAGGRDPAQGGHFLSIACST